MGQLVPDHRAHRAEVDRRVGLGVVERRLQERGGNLDAVPARVVPGVDDDGQRAVRHGEVVELHRLAELGELAPHQELVQPHRVADIVVATDHNACVVDPLRRVADADLGLVELGQRLRPRLRRQPAVALDPGAELRLHPRDHRLDLAPRLGGHVLRDVELGQRMSEQAGRAHGHLLGARRRHVLAIEDDAERGVRRIEGRRQVRRHPAQQLELQVRARFFRRRLGQDRVALAQRLDFDDHDFAAGRQPQRPEVRVEVDVGQEPLRVGVGHRHEALGRVALLQRRELLLRHARLECEHFLRRRARRLGRRAGDHQIVCHLRDVAVADALGIGLEIVVDAEPQARVADVDRYPGAVLRMRRHQRGEDHRIPRRSSAGRVPRQARSGPAPSRCGRTRV